jgi:heme exporter protein C
MLWPLLSMGVGFTLFFLTLLLLRMKSDVLGARLRNLRLMQVQRGEQA